MSATPMHLATTPEAGTEESYLADQASLINNQQARRCGCNSLKPRGNGKATDQQCIVWDPWTRQLPRNGIGRRLSVSAHRAPVVAAPSARQKRQGPCSGHLHDVRQQRQRHCRRRPIAPHEPVCSRPKHWSPERRTLRGDPQAAIRSNRGAYLGGSLTIARGYLAVAKPNRLP
jgi:hypothetical protein